MIMKLTKYRADNRFELYDGIMTLIKKMIVPKERSKEEVRKKPYVLLLSGFQRVFQTYATTHSIWRGKYEATYIRIVGSRDHDVECPYPLDYILKSSFSLRCTVENRDAEPTKEKR